MRILYFGYLYCFSFLFSRCGGGSTENYIDFLKVSDKTYLGISEVIDSLDVPWDIQYNDETESIFFTEIKGQLSELNLTMKGHIMASEHGDAIEDELNWVKPLENYRWKSIEGYHDLDEEKWRSER